VLGHDPPSEHDLHDQPLGLLQAGIQSEQQTQAGDLGPLGG
jgi:hypothetical protein